MYYYMKTNQEDFMEYEPYLFPPKEIDWEDDDEFEKMYSDHMDELHQMLTTYLR